MLCYGCNTPPERCVGATVRTRSTLERRFRGANYQARKGVSGPSSRVWIGALGPRAGDFILIFRIPRRPALNHSSGDATPLGNLAVVRAHPVHRHRRETALFSAARKTEPAVAVLGSHGTARTGVRAPVSKHTLLYKKNRVFDWRASFHPSPLDRRGMNHPHFPDSAPGVEERAITRVFGGVKLHVKVGKGCAVLNAKHKPTATPRRTVIASDGLWVRVHPGAWRRRDSTRRARRASRQRSATRHSPELQHRHPPPA